MIALLTILLAGVCDRIRGGFPPDDWFGESHTDLVLKNRLREAVKFTYGMVVCYPFGLPWWHLVLAGMTWKFGEQLAGNFGNMFKVFDNRTEGETWQRAVLRVGGLWPIATVLWLIFWQHHAGHAMNAWLLIPAMILANFGAALGSRVIGDTPWIPRFILDLRTAPAWMEFLRGFIVSALLFVLLSF